MQFGSLPCIPLRGKKLIDYFAVKGQFSLNLFLNLYLGSNFKLLPTLHSPSENLTSDSQKS